MRQSYSEEENTGSSVRPSAYQPESGGATGRKLAAAREEDRRYRQARSDRYQSKILAAQGLEILARNLALVAGGTILAGSLVFVLLQMLTGAPTYRYATTAAPGFEVSMLLYLGMLGLAIVAMFVSILLRNVGRIARKWLVRRSPGHLVEVYDPGDPAD